MDAMSSENLGFLEVLKSAPGNTIQDEGRIKWSHIGVPISGPLDRISYAWVNHVLRNDSNSAALEIIQPGFKAIFHHPTWIAWAGAKVKVAINDQELNSGQIHFVKANDQIEFGSFELGQVLYLGISGGFLTETILDSKSWYPEITSIHFVKKGQFLPFAKMTNFLSSSLAQAKWSTDWYQTAILDFYPGPDYSLLTESNRWAIESEEFTISTSYSRMGVILEETLPQTLPELPTNPVFPGFVQLTNGGKLILLGPDAQVTGGYPRVMILTEKAQAILAQKKPQQKLRFRKLAF